MTYQEYDSLKPGMYVRLRYGNHSLSRTVRKLVGKSRKGRIVWFKKIARSWTKSPYAFYDKWNVIHFMELVK